MRKKLFAAAGVILLICLPAATGLAGDSTKPSQATSLQTLLATALVLLCCVMFVIICARLFMRSSHGMPDDDMEVKPVFLAAILVAVAIRVITAVLYEGYHTDIGCFKGWAIAMYKFGPADFYTSGVFSDYPPGYMVVLWVLGFVREVFQINANGVLFTLIIKLPSIIAEVLTSLVAYRIAKRQAGRMFGFLCAAFVLFNPAMLFNSSVWGQIDAVFTLLIVLSLWLLTDEHYISAAAMFVVALAFKPQAIMFAPVVGLAYVYALFKKGGLKKAIVGIFGGIAAAAAVAAVFVLPFTGSQPLTWIVDKYAGTVGFYAYATLNAFNLYALLGANWVPNSNTLLFMPYSGWGIAFLVLICVVIVILEWRSRQQRRFFELSAFLVISVFMLVHSMHERYMLAACVCLLFAYVYTRDNATLFFAAAFSVHALLNQMVTLYAGSVVTEPVPTQVISALGVALYVVYAVITVRKLWSKKVLIKTPAMLG